MYKDCDRKKLEMKNAFKAFFTHILCLIMCPVRNGI